MAPANSALNCSQLSPVCTPESFPSFRRLRLVHRVRAGSRAAHAATASALVTCPADLTFDSRGGKINSSRPGATSRTAVAAKSGDKGDLLVKVAEARAPQLAEEHVLPLCARGFPIIREDLLEIEASMVIVCSIGNEESDRM